MKKLLSVMFALIMVLSVTTVPAFANEVQEPVENTEYLYLEEFIEQYKNTNGFYEDGYRENYEEVYYHYAENNDLNWVLARCAYVTSAGMNYAVYGDMVSLVGYGIPLKNNYAVYDVAQQKFIDICDLDDLSEYDGLKDILCSVKLLYPIGDADMDGILTILDATQIQRHLASLIQLDDDLEHYSSIKGELRYLTDMDRDGDRTIMDATAIQRKLAKLDYSIATPDEV